MDFLGKMKRYWAAYFPADDTFARIDSKKSAGNIKRLGLREIQVSFCGQWFDGTIVGDFDSAAACEKFLSQPIYDSEGGPPTPRKTRSFDEEEGISKRDESSLIVNPILETLVENATRPAFQVIPSPSNCNEKREEKAKRNLAREVFAIAESTSSATASLDKDEVRLGITSVSANEGDDSNSGDNPFQSKSSDASDSTPCTSPGKGKRRRTKLEITIPRRKRARALHFKMKSHGYKLDGSDDSSNVDDKDDPIPSTSSGNRGPAPKNLVAAKPVLPILSDENVCGTSSDYDSDDDSSSLEGDEKEGLANPPPKSRNQEVSRTYLSWLMGKVPSNMPGNVEIKPCEKSEDTTLYAKTQYCPFCLKGFSKVMRHIATIHANESSVQSFMAAKGKSRTQQGKMLRHAGNFHHNIQVLKEDSGDLVVVKRPKETTHGKYFPCANCLGFYYQSELWRHMRQCGTMVGKSSNPVMESRALLLCAVEENEALSSIQPLLETMRNDPIYDIIVKDDLLILYGQYLMLKHQEDQNPEGHIKQKLRHVARFMERFNIAQPDWVPLKDILDPGHFDLIVKTTKEFASDRSAVSLPLKIGHALKKCCAILRGQAIRKMNQQLRETTEAFDLLYTTEWGDRVARQSLTKLKNDKLNKKDEIPVTDDIVKLSRHLKETIVELMSEELNVKSWRCLSEMVLARLILFNKRRGGEAAQMRLEIFQVAQSAPIQLNQEIAKSLTPIELKLAERHLLVNVIGKRGRHVPILVPNDCAQAIQSLIEKREAVGVPRGNPFIFARPLKMTCLESCSTLKKCCKNVKLQKPDLITSTKLRKYLATACQIMSLPEEEMGWLATHLGHDIGIHRQFYRKQSDLIELCKISKLLIATEEGTLHEHKGKSLADLC